MARVRPSSAPQAESPVSVTQAPPRFDESRVTRRDPAPTHGRRPRGRGDGTTFLTIYLVLLFGIPARLVLGPLGGQGTPANIMGIVGLVWWVWSSIERHADRPRGARPVRRALAAFVLAVLASYLMGTLRPISGTELRSMESGLISVAAWSGVILVASDAIPSVQRLQVLLQRIALVAGLEASLGVLQFFSGVSLADKIEIPGLVSNLAAFGVGDRDGFVRPAGTAIHSIEFGISITALLPVCIYVATSPGSMGLLRRWFPVAVTALAIPLSVSRSAVIGAAIVLVILLPTWSPAARRTALLSSVGVILGIFVLVPGFLGSFSKLFVQIGDDPSALSRTNSYALAWEFISRSPVLGRGFLTFLPEYRILDNQYLGTLIDTGVVGLSTLVLLFATALVTAFSVRGRTSDPGHRTVLIALAAAVAAIAVGYAFFDAFSFPMASGVSFLIVGLISGAHRLLRSPGQKTASAVSTQRQGTPSKR